MASLCYHTDRMKSRSRWFFFIILNIIVSATVTGAVLYYYDHYQRVLVSPTIGSVLPTTPVEQVNYGDVKLEIVSVIGSGVAGSIPGIIISNSVDRETI